MENKNKWNGAPKLYSLAEWFVYLFLFGIIAYLSFLVFTYRFNTEDSIPIRTNLFSHILFVAAILGVSFAGGKLANKYTKLCRYISIFAYTVTVLFVGIVTWSFVVQTLILPGSDEKACYDIALRFLQSEFGAVVPEGSYLSLWPFQTGFIFILEKIMRVFNDIDPLLFQKINCFYLLMLVSSGYGVVCKITKRIEARILYLGLMATYWPLIFRVYEIYGDFPGLAWMMLSCMSFIFCEKENVRYKKNIYAIIFGVASIIACIYKRNCLIFVIAFVLVTMVSQLKKKRIWFAGWVILVSLLCIYSATFIQWYYETYANNVCGKGVPAISYIAMGLQYNGEDAIPGGWNGFHSSTFMENNYDYNKTVEISKKSIENSLHQFAQKPQYMVLFFHNKILKQWSNQTHGIYWGFGQVYNTSRNTSDDWVIYIENHEYEKSIIFEDFHESVIYGILLLACVRVIVKKWKNKGIEFSYTLPMVTFIGGFLFSVIWEAQPSAVMYYPILLLPVAIGVLFPQE